MSSTITHVLVGVPKVLLHGKLDSAKMVKFVCGPVVVMGAAAKVVVLAAVSCHCQVSALLRMTEGVGVAKARVT